jgi:hypothetical protein
MAGEVVPQRANDIIEHQLSERIGALGVLLESDVVALYGPIGATVDTVMRDVIEELHGRTRRRALTVLLTTDGGSIEVVQRIVAILRYHYEHVTFVVPDYAYSVGTILVMSGDVVYMDYFARLGPIDPQVELGQGQVVPALGYLIQYERLRQKARDGSLTRAETELMINGFDQAALFKYEQARELSVTLLREWLVKYKFQAGDGVIPTEMMRERAETIARELNQPERWHAHGSGISMDVLRRELEIEIEDFATKPELDATIKSYHSLLSDYMAVRGDQGVVHAPGQYVRFLKREPARFLERPEDDGDVRAAR